MGVSMCGCKDILTPTLPYAHTPTLLKAGGGCMSFLLFSDVALKGPLFPRRVAEKDWWLIPETLLAPIGIVLSLDRGRFNGR